MEKQIEELRKRVEQIELQVGIQKVPWTKIEPTKKVVISKKKADKK